MGINYVSIETARHHLELWLEAEAAVAAAQSYTIGSRSLTRADLGEIRRQISYWESVLDALENGYKGRRVVRAIPRDL